jgi:hypothetical protein
MPNMLKNGCFTESKDNALTPKDWTMQGAISNVDGINTETYLSGRKSFLFSATNQVVPKSLTQEVNIDLSTLEGNVLVASAWAKLQDPFTVPPIYAAPRFRLTVWVSYENTRTVEYFEEFDSSRADWQYVAIPIVLDRNKNSCKVEYRLDFSRNTVGCYFTNARLVAVNGVVTTNQYYAQDSTAYENVFDEKKYLSNTSTTFDGVLTTTNYQDRASDTVMTEVTDLDGRTFTSYYQYDSKHNLIKTEDYRGTVTEYTYDPTYGKQLTQKTYHKSDPMFYMFSENTYEEGHFLVSERDPRFEVDGKNGYKKTN